MFYDYETSFVKYDNLTFQEWADRHYVSKKFYDIMLKPALSVTLNEGEVFRFKLCKRLILNSNLLNINIFLFKRW